MSRLVIVKGKIYQETGERLVLVNGKIFKETIAAAPGGLSIPIAAYHYNHNTGSKL